MTVVKITHSVPTPVLSSKERKSLLRRAAPYALTATLGVIGLGAYEIRTSHLQRIIFTKVAKGELFTTLKPTGAGVPAEGPEGNRRGYNRVAHIDARLQNNPIQKFSRPENTMTYKHRSFYGYALNPIYDIKIQAGLHIRDEQGATLYSAPFPQKAYASFRDIPRPLVEMLLLVEDDELRTVEGRTNGWNYAVNWLGTAYAALLDIGSGLASPFGYGGGQKIGKSTLAIQLEKILFSLKGRTQGRGDKFVQIATATVRRYVDDDPQKIILRYVNLAPFSAYGRLGEQIGMPSAMESFFGMEFERVNQLLSKPQHELSDEEMKEAAKAYRVVLTLIMALTRPDDLRVNPSAVEERANKFIGYMRDKGVITPELAQRMYETPMEMANPADIRIIPKPRNKAADIYRNEMRMMLNEINLQTLDLLDMDVTVTLDHEVTRRVTERLRSFKDPKVAKALGLLDGERPMREETLQHLRLSYVLYEHTEDRSILRVLADTSPGQFNMIEKSLMSLGSMMKFPVMGEYFQLVEHAYEQLCLGAVAEQFDGHCNLDPNTLKEINVPRQDKIRQWVIGYLRNPATIKTKDAILAAASERRYSANTSERFFTNGGLAQYSNFDRKYDRLNPTLSEAFEKSMNLPFVRLMEDMKWYIIFNKLGVQADIMTNVKNPARKDLLRDYAAYDGLIHFNRYWAQQSHIKPDEVLDYLANKSLKTAPKTSDERLTVIFMTARPDASPDDLDTFITTHCGTCSKRQRIQDLHAKYANNRAIPGISTLADRAYTAQLHPLELWLLQQRIKNPGLGYRQAVELSYQARIDSYQSWLIDRNVPAAQNRALAIILEKKAFDYIHQSLRQKGYPLDRIVPAVNFPLSGEATLGFHQRYAGIVQRGGMKLPEIRYQSITFGKDTPYALPAFTAVAGAPERVMSENVATALQKIFRRVVENGTGQRAKNSVVLADGTVLQTGGKTGTSSGEVKDNADAHLGRNAGFTFTYGDRFSGAILVHMPPQFAAQERFTSGAAVTMKIALVHDIMPILNRAYGITPPQPIVRLPDGHIPKRDLFPKAAPAPFQFAEPLPLDFVLPALNR